MTKVTDPLSLWERARVRENLTSELLTFHFFLKLGNYPTFSWIPAFAGMTSFLLLNGIFGVTDLKYFYRCYSFTG